MKELKVSPGNTKGGSITVPLTSCLTRLESAVCQLTIFVFICKTDKYKLVKQEVNGTVILPPLVFPGQPIEWSPTPNGRVQGKLDRKYQKVPNALAY